MLTRITLGKGTGDLAARWVARSPSTRPSRAWDSRARGCSHVSPPLTRVQSLPNVRSVRIRQGERSSALGALTGGSRPPRDGRRSRHARERVSNPPRYDDPACGTRRHNCSRSDQLRDTLSRLGSAERSRPFTKMAISRSSRATSLRRLADLRQPPMRREMASTRTASARSARTWSGRGRRALGRGSGSGTRALTGARPHRRCPAY